MSAVSTSQERGLLGGDCGRLVLLLKTEELASCNVLEATLVYAGAILKMRLTDGCLPALYRGEAVAVRCHFQQVPKQVPWVLSGGGGDPPQHCLRTVECLSYIVQCANGTKRLKEWQPGVHSFRQDTECSISVEAFYLQPWKRRFQLVDINWTFGPLDNWTWTNCTSESDEEWKKSAAFHNLTTVSNVIEPYVSVAPQMIIATSAAGLPRCHVSVQDPCGSCYLSILQLFTRGAYKFCFHVRKSSIQNIVRVSEEKSEWVWT